MRSPIRLCLSFGLSFCLSVFYSLVCLSVFLVLCSLVCLSISHSFCVSVCLTISLPVCLRTCLFVLSICLSVCLSVCLSACLSFCLVSVSQDKLTYVTNVEYYVFFRVTFYLCSCRSFAPASSWRPTGKRTFSAAATARSTRSGSSRQTPCSTTASRKTNASAQQGKILATDLSSIDGCGDAVIVKIILMNLGKFWLWMVLF